MNIRKFCAKEMFVFAAANPMVKDEDKNKQIKLNGVPVSKPAHH
jgi:hypothetical protein